MREARVLVRLMLIGGFVVGCGDNPDDSVDASQMNPSDAAVAGDGPLQVSGDDAPAADASTWAGGDSGSVVGGIATPTGLSVSPGDTPGTAKVRFAAPAVDGGGVGLGYVVTANPGGITATGTGSPIALLGLTPATGYTFSLVASDGVTQSAPVTSGLLTFYDVVETFREPKTQPNDTIFSGSFTFDSTNNLVSNLAGSLTQSMTKVNGTFGGPMTTVALANQLSSVPTTLDGAPGFLVTTFALPVVDTFTGGGFAPGGKQYFGLLEGTANNNNAYAMIFVNTSDPTTTPTQGQIDKLAYADCSPGGMMMKTCMTGTSEAGYGVKGSMGGYPLSQVISKR